MLLKTVPFQLQARCAFRSLKRFRPPLRIDYALLVYIKRGARFEDGTLVIVLPPVQLIRRLPKLLFAAAEFCLGFQPLLPPLIEHTLKLKPEYSHAVTVFSRPRWSVFPYFP
jgi:hypothetical protein